MGQALSFCAPCCSSTEDVESYQIATIPNDMNPQWKERIKTNCDKIVLAGPGCPVLPTEEEIAADRMKILMNLGTVTCTQEKKLYGPEIGCQCDRWDSDSDSEHEYSDFEHECGYATDLRKVNKIQ